MQENIVTYLINTYNPNSIILHGSRARGKERPRSDWDFILIYSGSTHVKNGRTTYENENVEFTAHALPVSDIYEQFGAKLQEATVVYEKTDEGTLLLRQASDYYAQGVSWSSEKIADHKLWMEGRINGMKDNIENPIIFNKYFSDFYARVCNYWYWILQSKHSQPIYIATEEIAQKDPEYHELICNLVKRDTTLEDKVVIAEKICARLFD